MRLERVLQVMGRPARPGSILTDGSDYTPAQVEFGRAMEAWKRWHERQPNCWDVLNVARRLGYFLPDPPLVEPQVAALMQARDRTK